MELTQQLAFNVRTLCSDTLFFRAARGACVCMDSICSHQYLPSLTHPPPIVPLPVYPDIEVLYEREDWQVHAEEGGIITSLPILFENRIVEVLLTLKEIVIETHPGETEVREHLVSSLAFDLVLFPGYHGSCFFY